MMLANQLEGPLRVGICEKLPFHGNLSVTVRTCGSAAYSKWRSGQA